MSNNNITGTTSSNFQYVTKSSYIESNIPEVLGVLHENMLDFSTKFEAGEVTRPYLAMIAAELKSTARYFGEQQGLTRLLNFIEAEVWGNYIHFWNSAKDDYGRYYAGHVEYGHYSKNKKSFVEARPFMRPALYAVSKASTGELSSVLRDMLMTIFRDSGRGYQGISELNFGNKLGNLYHYRSGSSNFVSKSLSSQKIFEVDEGRKRDNYTMKGNELNLMPNFDKRMSGWSLKRGLTNSHQSRLLSDAGFNSKGRQSQKPYSKYALNSFYNGRTGASIINQAQAHSKSITISPPEKGSKQKTPEKSTWKKTTRGIGREYRPEQIHQKGGGEGFFRLTQENRGKTYSSSNKKIKKTTQYKKPLNKPYPFYNKISSASNIRKVQNRSDLVKEKVMQTKGYISQNKGKNKNQNKVNLVKTKQKESSTPVGAKKIDGLSGYYNINVYTPSGSTTKMEVSESVLKSDFYYDKNVKAYKYKMWNYS